MFMNTYALKKAWLTVGMIATVAPVLIAAQPGESPNRSFGYMARLEKSVGLSPEQRDAVRGLMAEQRQKTQAVREEVDGKIRSLLNGEQQKKYDAFRAQNKAKRGK